MENQASLQENSAQLSTKRGEKRKAEEEPYSDEWTKRVRISFTTEQLLTLESLFCLNKYPDAFQREDIADKLNLKEKNISNWFQNRRTKEKKIAAQESPRVPLPYSSSATSYSSSAPTTAPLNTTPTLHPVLPSCNQFFAYPNYSLRSSTTDCCGYNTYLYPPQQLHQPAPTNITSSSNSYSHSAPITTTRPLPLTTTPTLRTVLPPFNQLFSCPIYTLPPTGDTTRIR